jgi:hypothetical protein
MLFFFLINVLILHRGVDVLYEHNGIQHPNHGTIKYTVESNKLYFHLFRDF